MKKVLSIPFIIFSLTLHGQNARERWVDSVFQSMSPQQKIGQILMIPVSSYDYRDQSQSMKDQIKKFQPGFIQIIQGGPVSHLKMMNGLQKLCTVPFMGVIEANSGVGQVLDSVIRFQPPIIQGAAGDSMVFNTGRLIGQQMKRLGLQINFAPNADIDISEAPYPQALNYFGENKNWVANRSIALVAGLSREGVFACATHAPDLEKDKLLVKGEPVIYYDINRVDTLDFFPYQKLIEANVFGISTSHLHFSTANKKKPLPASLSEVFISEILKQKIGFQGLTFSEIPYLMKIIKKRNNGSTELLAFQTGNDVLIAPQNLKGAIKKILRVVKKDIRLQNQLDVTVKKILTAKYAAGLHQWKNLSSDNLIPKLNSPEANLLKHQMAESAVTVVRNDKAILPVKTLDNRHFHHIILGKDADNEFSHYLNKYAPFQHHVIKSLSDTLRIKELLVSTSDFVVVSLFEAISASDKRISIIKELTQKCESVVAGFGDARDLKIFEDSPTALVASYYNGDLMPQATAEVIFGGIPGKGALPVSISEKLKSGNTIETESLQRFSYTTPEAVGMDSRTLEKIKEIAQEAVDIGATPGCHIFVVKDGKVVMDQSVGWLDYSRQEPVTDETIYDLASVTKVSATLQTTMFLAEKGLIDINKKISTYLPELKSSNKKDFLVKDILTHQAGLWPFLPFWAQTMNDKEWNPTYYGNSESDDYPFPVSQGLFATKAMKDSLWQWIIKAKIREKPPRTVFDYRYSDMGFYILQHLAEKILNQPMEDFLSQNIYDPIGAYTVGYLPLRKFAASQIAPTEDDKLFRKSLLRGYVHDQGAAMHGGTAGHAGLFSNANDLAKLGQLWLQKGHYGGTRIFKEETIDTFTQKQYADSRRGLGWDKPTPSDWNGPTSLFASPKTFGHTGFTGTCIWVDPEFNLVYVFLSNRVNPDMNNNRLLNANIRPRIQDVIYRSIFNFCQNRD